MELILKDAIALFERQGPNVAEIFSQPRVCQEVDGRSFDGTDLLRPEVGSVTCHMCAFGMTSTDQDGEGLVQKATRLMSSSEEMPKRMDVRCSNESSGEVHRHVRLEQGRARQA